jgi:hypothetical protein
MAGGFSFVSIWRIVRFAICKFFRVKGHGISILVPAHLTDNQRQENWKWLQEYWKTHLPGAEVIIGDDPDAASLPFSKSVAVNHAATLAHGDVFVIVDADVFISVETVVECAQEIRLAEKKGHSLWFMPYRKLYRLTQDVSARLLKSSPNCPLDIPVAESDIMNVGVFEGKPLSQVGHWYGAMIQIVSREAFFTVGGWDRRFRGWGGEDHAAMVAMDTLYGPHKTTPGHILHIWHPVLTPDTANDPKGKKRIWANQDGKQTNDALSGRYYWSKGNPQRMRGLVNEFLSGKTAAKPTQQKQTPPSVSS